MPSCDRFVHVNLPDYVAEDHVSVCGPRNEFTNRILQMCELVPRERNPLPRLTRLGGGRTPVPAPPHLGSVWHVLVGKGAWEYCLE